MSSRRQRSIPLGGRYKQVSLYHHVLTLTMAVVLGPSVTMAGQNVLCIGHVTTMALQTYRTEWRHVRFHVDVLTVSNSRRRPAIDAWDNVTKGSTLYSEGSFVRRFFSPKPFEVAMLRRTYGPKVLYSEVPLLRKLLCSEDSIFRKAPHYMDSMLRRFFSPKFI